jgi:hypothetical protein
MLSLTGRLDHEELRAFQSLTPGLVEFTDEFAALVSNSYEYLFPEKLYMLFLICILAEQKLQLRLIIYDGETTDITALRALGILVVVRANRNLVI